MVQETLLKITAMLLAAFTTVGVGNKRVPTAPRLLLLHINTQEKQLLLLNFTLIEQVRVQTQTQKKTVRK